MSDEKWSGSFSMADGTAIYEQLLVRRMFDHWSALLLDQLKVGAGEQVLDVATGTGSLARAAAERVGPAGRVVGCDISPAMLDLAKAKRPVRNGASIDYRECPADALDVEAGAFDVITCQQGLQFFPDRPAALAQMKRVARPDPRIGIATWSSIDECPIFAALATGIQEVVGDEAAAQFRAGPWGLSDEETLKSLVDGAGFSSATITTQRLPLVFEGGVRQHAAFLATSPVVDTIQALGAGAHERLLAAATRYLGVASPDTPVETHMTSHITLATA